MLLPGRTPGAFFGKGTDTMNQDTILRRTGYVTFLLSGVCAISSGIIVSILQDLHGLSFGVTGTLLSMMNIGNMAAAFLAGVLPGRIGLRKTVLLLSAGYCLGYLLTGATGAVPLMMLAFLLIGIAKGCVLNADSVLVGTHTDNRKTSMQIMHSFYACGALLCPVLVSLLLCGGSALSMFGVAAVGLVLWLIYARAPLPGPTAEKGGKKRDLSFLHDSTFWVLTMLIFCQNAAENSVTGWLVTYYKDQGILSGALSGYTLSIMWGATLLARLLIAFVLPIKNTFKALGVMGFFCTLLYAVMLALGTPIPVTAALFLFSLSMAGVNPMATASVGSALNSESMGVMLPIGSIGGIVMPAIIGAVANHAGLHAGMLCNLVPCAGILILSLVMLKRQAV